MTLPQPELLQTPEFLYRIQERSVEGWPAGIELTYWTNRKDLKPRRVSIAVVEHLAGFEGRIPAAFEMIEPDRSASARAGLPRFATIRVVAGPGVSVRLDGFPDSYTPDMNYPAVQVFRVQDPASVPPMADGINPSNYQWDSTLPDEEDLAPDFALDAAGLRAVVPPAGRLPLTRGRDNAAWNQILVQSLPDGVMFHHPATASRLLVVVPTAMRAGGSFLDAQARFAYDVDPGTSGPMDARPLLTLVVTSGVQLIRFDERFTLGPSRPAARDEIEHFSFYEAGLASSIHDIPAQGTPFEMNFEWEDAVVIRAPSKVERDATLSLIGMEMGVGAIPVVGELIDLGHLAKGLLTGRDLLGRRLSTMDFVVLGVGLLIPFVAAGALRAAPRLLAAFGHRADEVVSTLERLKRAQLTPEEAKLIEGWSDLVRKGEKLDSGSIEALSKILARVQERPLTPEVLLNGARDGFMHGDLQAAYTRYVAKRSRKKGARTLSPVEWAYGQTTGNPRKILESLLGKDYARGVREVPDRWRKLADVPRPPDFADDKVVPMMQTMMVSRQKIFERLDNMLSARRSGNPITRFIAARRINVSHFWILKGNVAEVLSMPQQIKILASIKSKFPTARIYSGIRVQLPAKAKGIRGPVLFSDNIIAREINGRLEILAVVEVKSGYQGGESATKQVFEWIERRLDDGSEIVLTSKGKTIDVDGSEAAMGGERRYTFKPTDPKAMRVDGLANAERHLFIAKGRSHVGADSADRIAPVTGRHDLPLSAAEIDYLTARIARDAH